MNSRTAPRSVDHLVLPVRDIDKAAEWYEALGFTVAPRGLHPFGTENRCIFFADGTFLEPIAVAHRETCEAAAVKGNTFVRNDQAYRFRVGEDGFSHLVIASSNASDDDRLFRKSGLSGGRMVRFSRAFETPSGDKAKASFKLAFAADKRAPDASFFACEVVDAPAVDRSTLQRHENGVTGLKEIVLTERNPTDFQYFLQTFLRQRYMDADSFGMSFATGNTTVSVLTPDGLFAFYGQAEAPRERGLLLKGFVLAVSDLAAIKSRLKAADIGFNVVGNRLVLPPTEGQGAFIAFEEDTN